MATASAVRVNPTTVKDDWWVWASAPSQLRAKSTLGKWLVFKKINKLDATWHRIREGVESGELGATGAKSSTARERSEAQIGPRQKNVGVICVYTSQEDMDEVGLKLIYLVQQDIRYKTDEATLKGMYTARGYEKVTCRTIYWNSGDPSFERQKQPRK